MIKLHLPPGPPMYHRLIANKKVNDMKVGDIKDVLIQKDSSGHFIVMGVFFLNLMEPKLSKMDFFYKRFESERLLHETFTEQFTNQIGFSKGE